MKWLCKIFEHKWVSRITFLPCEGSCADHRKLCKRCGEDVVLYEYRAWSCPQHGSPKEKKCAE